MLMHLEGLDWLAWERIHDLVGEQECAWADLDGFHVGPVPGAAPPSTHVWSWSPTRWIRVRIDGNGGIVGVLSLDRTTGGAVEAVSVQLARGHPWRNDDERVMPLADALVEQPWTLLTVMGLRPVTFVHRGPSPANTDTTVRAGEP